MSHKREQIIRTLAAGVTTDALAKIAERFPHLISEAERELQGKVEYVMLEKRPNIDQLSKEQLAEVVALVRSGWKVSAIKKLRELTKCGLKEAFDYVQSL